MAVKRVRDAFFIVLLTICSISAYQNCSVIHVPVGSTKMASGGGGNGDGYEGKLTIYNLRSTTQPCAELDVQGRALPNETIFYYATSANAKFVRKTCADITPIHIPKEEIQIGVVPNTIRVAGTDYLSQPEGDFAVVSADCPAGMTLKATPVRQNMIGDSQNIVDSSQWWWIQPTISSTLIGSFGALPSWELSRGAGSFNWRRASNVLPLTAGTLYSYSFLARERSINKAEVWLWQCGAVYPCAPHMSVVLGFDLATQAVETIDQTGVSSLSTSMKPFAGGQFITIYFTPTGSFETDLGITPYSPTYNAPEGDSIEATAVQLEDVSNYCQ